MLGGKEIGNWFEVSSVQFKFPVHSFSQAFSFFSLHWFNKGASLMTADDVIRVISFQALVFNRNSVAN